MVLPGELKQLLGLRLVSPGVGRGEAEGTDYDQHAVG